MIQNYNGFGGKYISNTLGSYNQEAKEDVINNKELLIRILDNHIDTLYNILIGN
jgi:hypothetical protein